MGVLIGNLSPPSFEISYSQSKKTLVPQVKLVDLKQASIVNPNDRGVAGLEATLYSCPELHSGKSFGFEGDAYSLGVILSIILFDCLPF